MSKGRVCDTTDKPNVKTDACEKVTGKQNVQMMSVDTPTGEQEDEAGEEDEIFENGLGKEDIRDRITAMDIQPTLTAHPTEVRRWSILHKQTLQGTNDGPLQ